jgi:ribonuclease III family protein
MLTSFYDIMIFGDNMNTKEINVLALAFLGDALYELYIRRYLLSIGYNDVNKLQKETVKYVSAKNQARFLKILSDEFFFNEDETNIVKRARNYRNNNHPKNCDILTYKHATGLEALLGELYLNGQMARIEEIINRILEVEGC